MINNKNKYKPSQNIYMLEYIKEAIETLKEDRILILFTLLPFVIMLILTYALGGGTLMGFGTYESSLSSLGDLGSLVGGLTGIDITKGLSGLTTKSSTIIGNVLKQLLVPTSFIPPFMGSEIFWNNIAMNSWINLAKLNAWKDLGMQMFLFGIAVYYFIIYSLYSSSKLGTKLTIIQCLLLALLFAFLFSYLSKLKVVIISSLAVLFIFVVPISNSGLGLMESFKESFRMVKENFLEIISLFLFSVGIIIVVGMFWQDFVGTILDLFKLSYNQYAIAYYIFIALFSSVIIAFQIVLFTNYFLTKRKITSVRMAERGIVEKSYPTGWSTIRAISEKI
jgi:hypothetical protein